MCHEKRIMNNNLYNEPIVDFDRFEMDLNVPSLGSKCRE